MLSPVLQLPVELEKQFVVLQHDLPDRDELEEIARGIATEDGELPDGRELTSVLDASAGLTRSAAESAFSLSLVRDNRITPEAVWEIKEGTLRQSGPITLHRGGEDFSSLGGLSALKAFCNRSLLASQATRNVNASPRGVMLLSPPGCGKSQFCKCLGRETGRPVLMLDVGAAMGSLIGQSEERIRQALQIAEAMAPSILMIDEVEKAFAGVGGTGDSGASSRVLGDLYSPSDYPASLLGQFCMAWEFPSVEPPCYLQDLSPELYQQETARARARFDEAVRLAETAFTEELAQMVDHLSDRLSGSDDGKPKTFRDTAIENLQSFFERFQNLNIGSNEQLDRLVQQSREILNGVAPQQLRDSPSLRQRITTQLAGVQNSLDGLMVDRPRRNIQRRRPR